ERAQQGEWWSGLSKLFSGDAVFHDCSDASTARAGGSDEAGFVQVMQGRSDDVQRLREIMKVLEERFPDVRPDLLGYLLAAHDGEEGAFTQVFYFTSEEDARAGERGETPAEMAEMLRAEMERI